MSDSSPPDFASTIASLFPPPPAGIFPARACVLTPAEAARLVELDADLAEWLAIIKARSGSPRTQARYLESVWTHILTLIVPVLTRILVAKVAEIKRALAGQEQREKSWAVAFAAFNAWGIHYGLPLRPLVSPANYLESVLTEAEALARPQRALDAFGKWGREPATVREVVRQLFNAELPPPVARVHGASASPAGADRRAPVGPELAADLAIADDEGPAIIIPGLKS